MKTLSSFAVVIAAALMLSGCFVSNSSFITSTSADYPFGSAVSYDSTDENGITIEGMLRREGDFYRRATSGTPSDKYLLFQRLRDDYYIVQEFTPGSSANYDLVRITPETVYLFNFRCDTLLDAVAIQEGRMTTSTDSLGGLVCTLQDLETLREALGERIAFAAPKEEFRIIATSP